MQEALPYKRWEALPSTMSMASPSLDGGGGSSDNDEISSEVLGKIASLVKENPVIVFGKRGCCMCHVVRKLLLGLGVNPPVFEIDADANESLLLSSLSNVLVVDHEEGSNVNVSSLQFPLVFMGGKLYGGLDKVMATHLSGELVPILKQAGALWL